MVAYSSMLDEVRHVRSGAIAMPSCPSVHLLCSLCYTVATMHTSAYMAIMYYVAEKAAVWPTTASTAPTHANLPTDAVQHVSNRMGRPPEERGGGLPEGDTSPAKFTNPPFWLLYPTCPELGRLQQHTQPSIAIPLFSHS